MYVGIMQEEHADDYYTHYRYYSMFLPCSAAVLPQFPDKFTKCFSFFFARKLRINAWKKLKNRPLGFPLRLGRFEIGEIGPLNGSINWLLLCADTKIPPRKNV